MTEQHNDLDNDMEETMDIGMEWIAAHLLATIMFLENKFGNDAGFVIGEIAENLIAQFKEAEPDSE